MILNMIILLPLMIIRLMMKAVAVMIQEMSSKTIVPGCVTEVDVPSFGSLFWV